MRRQATRTVIVLAATILAVQSDGLPAETPIGQGLEASVDVRTLLSDDSNGRFDSKGVFRGAVRASSGITVTRVNIWEDLAPHAVFFSGMGDIEIEPDIAPTRLELEGVIREPVLFFQFRVKPALDTVGQAHFTIDAGGVRLAFALLPGSKSTAQVLAFDPSAEVPEARGERTEPGRWIPTGIYFAVTGDGRSGVTQSYTLRLDLQSARYDLWQDERLILTDLPYEPRTPRLWIRSVSSKPGLLSELALSEDNPLFADGDVDGIPDAFEREIGGADAFDDRDWIVPGYAMTLIELYRLSHRATAPTPAP